MIQTAQCRIASGPSLGGFPVLAEYRIISPDRSTGDLWSSAEIISLSTLEGTKLADWFQSKLSDDQWLDLIEQCAIDAGIL